MKVGEVQGQHSSWPPHRVEESRGSEGILGDHQTSQALGDGLWGGTEQTSQHPQKFQLVLILSETPQSGAITAIPLRLPQSLPKQTHCQPSPTAASHPSRQGKQCYQPRTACPCSHLGLTHLLLLILRARALQVAPLHPMYREKKQVTKRVMAQFSAHCIWMV